MVRNNGDFIRIPDPGTKQVQLFSNLDPGAEDIVQHGPVDLDPDYFAGGNRVKPGTMGQDFFTHRHTHIFQLLCISIQA